MSEPEAKQYLLDSIERCRGALSALDSAGNSSLQTHKKTLEEVLKLLDGLQEKVFFKTKKAVSPAFHVSESSQTVADLADGIADADEQGIREFGDAVGQLRDNAAALESASKTQSVIVT